MRAVFFRSHGGLDVLEEGDLPLPEPGPGEVRLRVTFATSPRALRKGGRVVTSGATTGGEFPVPIGDVYWPQLEILGSTMGGRKEFAAVSRLVFSGKVRPAIDRVVPLTLENVRAGHEGLEQGTQFGKIVYRVTA